MHRPRRGYVVPTLLSLLGVATGAAPPAALSAEPIRLRVMAVAGHQDFVPPIEAQVNAFNARHKDIQVELELHMASWPQFLEKFTVLLLAGNAPDLVMGGGGAFQRFVEEGVFIPIDKYIQRDQINLKDFFPGPLSATMIDGKYYSLPGGTSTRAVAYNKNMFAEAGIAFPRFRWGWYEDVLPIARKLTQRTRDKHRYGLAFWVWHGAHHLGDIASIIWGHGGDVFNESQTEFILGDPRGTQAMEFIIDLITKHRVFPDNFDALGHFMAGRLGMWFAGTWDAAILAKAPFEVGWAAQPYGPVADVATAGGGPSYTITAQSKHPDAAWEFLKFVTSPEGQRLSDSMPSHRGAVDQYLRASPKHEDREVYIYNLARSRLVRFPKQMPEIQRILNESGWKRMLTGEIPFRSYMADVTPRINRLLQENAR